MLNSCIAYLHLKQIGLPLCAAVLLKVSSRLTGSFFIAPVAIVFALKAEICSYDCITQLL